MTLIRHLVSRVSESLVTLVISTGLTLLLGTFWVKAEAAHRAPVVPGYEWSQHPKALLIVVPAGDCGCSIAPMSVVREAFQRHISVVVASGAPNDNTRQLSQMHQGAQRAWMAEHMPRDFLLRFAPKAKVGFVCIQDGRIISQSEGQSSTLFLDKLQKEGA